MLNLNSNKAYKNLNGKINFQETIKLTLSGLSYFESKDVKKRKLFSVKLYKKKLNKISYESNFSRIRHKII